MAFASWVSPNKHGGSGNDTVSWTGQVHTGRVARSTSATFSASGVESKVLTINQAGKAEFVTLDAQASVDKAGGTITISGRSNSSKLTFSLANNNIGLDLPPQYTAGGTQTSNGVTITGDPGAAQEFIFSITFSGLPANTTINELTSQLTVTDAGGHKSTCAITQASGDAYLTLSTDTIELTAAGTAVSVEVQSNTSWTIS